jgi:hypothetical protein
MGRSALLGASTIRPRGTRPRRGCLRSASRLLRGRARRSLRGVAGADNAARTSWPGAHGAAGEPAARGGGVQQTDLAAPVQHRPAPTGSGCHRGTVNGGSRRPACTVTKQHDQPRPVVSAPLSSSTSSSARRSQLLSPRRSRLDERGAAPGKHLGIGDRLPLPPRLGLRERECSGAGAAAPTSGGRQAAQR